MLPVCALVEKKINLFKTSEGHTAVPTSGTGHIPMVQTGLNLHTLIRSSVGCHTSVKLLLKKEDVFLLSKVFNL